MSSSLSQVWTAAKATSRPQVQKYLQDLPTTLHRNLFLMLLSIAVTSPTLPALSVPIQRRSLSLRTGNTAMILAENIKQMQSASGFLCTAEKDIPYGKQLRLPTRTIVNSYDTGKVTIYGKSVEQVQKVLIGSIN